LRPLPDGDPQTPHGYSCTSVRWLTPHIGSSSDLKNTGSLFSSESTGLVLRVSSTPFLAPISTSARISARGRRCVCEPKSQEACSLEVWVPFGLHANLCDGAVHTRGELEVLVAAQLEVQQWVQVPTSHRPPSAASSAAASAHARGGAGPKLSPWRCPGCG